MPKREKLLKVYVTKDVAEALKAATKNYGKSKYVNDLLERKLRRDGFLYTTKGQA